MSIKRCFYLGDVCGFWLRGWASVEGKFHFAFYLDDGKPDFLDIYKVRLNFHWHKLLFSKYTISNFWCIRIKRTLLTACSSIILLIVMKSISHYLVSTLKVWVISLVNVSRPQIQYSLFIPYYTPYFRRHKNFIFFFCLHMFR